MQYILDPNDRQFAAFKKQMDQLPRSFQNRVSRAGAHAVAQVIRDEARTTSLFRDKTRKLRRSIRAVRRKVRISRRLRSTFSVVLAGARRGAVHAVFVAYGKTNRDGSKSRPRNFLNEAAANVSRSSMYLAFRRAAVTKYKELEVKLRSIR